MGTVHDFPIAPRATALIRHGARDLHARRDEALDRLIDHGLLADPDAPNAGLTPAPDEPAAAGGLMAAMTPLAPDTPPPPPLPRQLASPPPPPVGPRPHCPEAAIARANQAALIKRAAARSARAARRARLARLVAPFVRPTPPEVAVILLIACAAGLGWLARAWVPPG